MTAKTSFGTWLRQRRRTLDLTQQAFADQVGCARITLSRIEADTLKPSKELALILLEKVGIPLSEREQWVPFARGHSGLPSKNVQPFISIGPQTNLPVSLTSFIGREKEQKEIIQLIGKHRLVTLAASGGVGKTRLALKVGEQLSKDYIKGVWFVDLASLNESAMLPQAIAAIFNIPSQSNTPVTELLINFLHNKSLLLILDNCEHLLDACIPLITTLLTNCADLKILATSREALAIDGEALYRVSSFSVPVNQSFELTENISGYESVRLFIERAQLVQTNFSMTIENNSSVVQICHRLDGIPLAIELAAARVDVLQVDEIWMQLQQCFDLLQSNQRTVIPRHQTMRASIDWSWNLLTEPEQIFMSQLSIFAGGWTFETAQAVCDGDVLSLTSALVRKSLIMVYREAGQETRYRFHEIIRQYAREKLVESGEEVNIARRHLEYFLQLSEQAELALKGSAQKEWYARLRLERDNIRAALVCAAQTDIEAGLYIAGRLHRFWERFDIREGARWLEEFIQKPESHNYSLARAKALLAWGWQQHIFQNFGLAHSVGQECLELYQACNDKQGEVDALTLLGSMLPSEGVPDMEILQRALSLAQSINDPWRQAMVLDRMSFVESEYQWKIYDLEKALRFYRKAGDLQSVAGCLSGLGKQHGLNGEFKTSQRNLEEMMELNRQLGTDIGMGGAAVILSRIESMNGAFEKARSLLEERISVFKDFGIRMPYLWTCVYLGHLLSRQGDIIQARDILAKTVQEFYRDNSEIGIAFTLEGVSGVYAAQNKPEHAARLIGWADAIRKKVSDERPALEQADVDKIIDVCLAQMGEVAFSDAYDEGQKMTLDQVVALALKIVEET